MNERTVVVRTERLSLCETALEDEDLVVQSWTDEELTRYIGGPRDPERVREAVREAIGKPEPIAIWTALDRATGEHLGDCGLVKKEIDGREEVEVFYLIRRSHQGRGLATEAARALQQHAAAALALTRLVALIHPDNAASLRVAEKAGFRFEREVTRDDGRRLLLHAWTASSTD